MSRALPFIVLLVELVLAAGAGAAGFVYLQLALGESVAVGLAVLIVLVTATNALQRRRDRVLFNRRIADLAHLETTFTRNMQNAIRRLTIVEARLDKMTPPTTPAADGDVRGLAATVRQLAADLEELEYRVLSAGHAVVPAAASGALPAADLPAPDADALAAAVRDAIASENLELLLQPIVTLPQRRAHGYELFTRLHDGEGGLILPATFLPIAEREGLSGRLDQLVLFRAVRILRRLTENDKSPVLFCNLSGASLDDGDASTEFIEFAQANRALAGMLVFELTQANALRLAPTGREALAALAELGFRLSLDQVTDFTTDFRDLAARGYRFVKVSAETLLSGRTGGHVDSTELSDLLARSGIDLIADHVETERQVIDLIDFDIRFGQGYLFAPPRPLRADLAAATPTQFSSAAQ